MTRVLTRAETWHKGSRLHMHMLATTSLNRTQHDPGVLTLAGHVLLAKAGARPHKAVVGGPAVAALHAMLGLHLAALGVPREGQHIVHPAPKPFHFHSEEPTLGVWVFFSLLQQHTQLLDCRSACGGCLASKYVWLYPAASEEASMHRLQCIPQTSMLNQLHMKTPCVCMQCVGHAVCGGRQN